MYPEMNATEGFCIDFMFLALQQSFWIRYCSRSQLLTNTSQVIFFGHKL